MRHLMPAVLVALAVSDAFAEDSTARKAGRAYGEFSRGVGEAIYAPMLDNLPRNVIENVEPRPKAECLKEAAGVIDKTYMRCRNGAQLTYRVRSDGSRELIREQPLPTN